MVSDVWRFCSRLADNLVRCNYCGRVMTYHGTTNLRVHVGRHFGMKPMRNFQTGGFIRKIALPPQPGSNSADVPPQAQPSASVGRPPMQPKQVDIKREQLSPRERPSPLPHPQPPMPTPVAHQQAPLPAPPSHPHTQQLPPPRRSAPAQMRPPSPVLPAQPAAPPPEVCLRWNSYHSNMQATFPSLLNNEQFVDVTLACEGHSIKCHKVMLSACSSYFEELLSQNPCQHPIVLMKDLRFWEVQALVDFMYRGEVNVTQDKLPSLLAAAEALQIKGLAGPASNSHDSESSMSRGAYGDMDPLRRRKRRIQMPDPAELLPRNPVGRPRIHPKLAPRPQIPTPAAPSNMPPRIQVRPEQQLQQRPQQMDEGPPARRMKPSPPPSPVIMKMEPLETELSNDSMDKVRYLDRDGGDSGGSGDGSNHGDSLVDLSQERYGINNGLPSDRNREHSDDQENEHDDDRHLDDDDDRGPDHDRNQLRDQELDQENEPDDDQDMDQDPDNDHDRDTEQGLGGSEEEQDIPSSDDEPYENEPHPDSRQHQPENLADHLLGRL